MGPAVDSARLLAELRAAAGLTQREVAVLAGTSQPAVARYESGAATPSWSTLERLVAALGHRLEVGTHPTVDPDDLALAAQLLAMSVTDRLTTLARFARLHDRAVIGT